MGMTIMGFMLALLFSGFRLASDSWDSVSRQSQRTTKEEAARALVRRLTTQLQPIRWKRAVNQPLAFSGDPDGFRGLAPVSAQAGMSGLRVIELRATSSDKGQGHAGLILRQSPLNYDAEVFSDGLEGAEPRQVLDGLTAIQFAYFGAPKSGEPPQWFDSWPNPEQLPQLVRISLRSSDGGWSDVLVSPRINGAGCRWNSFYKKCMTR